jgi:hypothetical protein
MLFPVMSGVKRGMRFFRARDGFSFFVSYHSNIRRSPTVRFRSRRQGYDLEALHANLRKYSIYLVRRGGLVLL